MIAAHEAGTITETRVREMAVKSILWETFKQNEVSLEECFLTAQQKVAWHIAQLQTNIQVECKEEILNVLVKVPVADRLKPLTFGLLRLPRFGGVSITTVEIMNALVCIYETNPMPSKFNTQLRRLNVYDFKVICCFFNVLVMLDKINLVVWDANTVRRIDQAMMHKRNILFQGQRVPAHTYDVVVTLCCSRVATFQGKTTYGHKAVAYDIEQHTFVCSKKKGKKNTITSAKDLLFAFEDPLDAGGGQRRKIRNQRKDFMAMECKGQPVLRINLRGFHLVYGSERDKRIRYCHCPCCGSFHIFKWANFAGSVDASYRCEECMEIITHEVYECSYCLARPKDPIDRFTAYATSLYVLHPEEEHANEPYKLLYFCKKHHSYARPKSEQLPRQMLWSYIQEKEAQRRLRAAMGYFMK